jgi:hypothetical protein
MQADLRQTGDRKSPMDASVRSAQRAPGPSADSGFVDEVEKFRQRVGSKRLTPLVSDATLALAQESRILGPG